MKLLNIYADDGATAHLGVVQEGRVLDLSEFFRDDACFSSVSKWIRAGEKAYRLTQDFLAHKAGALSAWRNLEDVHCAPLLDRECRIFGVGLNYSDHVAENRIAPPETPVYFAKLASGVITHEQAIPLPPISDQVDYEAEFAFLVGRRARCVAEKDAEQYIAGYTIMNDVTARDLQLHDKQWFRGKNCDGFAPLGPWIVTAEEVPDPHSLEITLRLNGQIRQHSNTRNLIFKPPALLSFLSQTLTLEPGDVISTGTPGGVGYYSSPKVFLRPGDVVEIEVERIGTLRNRVVRGPTSVAKPG